jgi:Zn-finger protein
MTNPDSTQRVRLDIRCPHNEEHKLIELLLSNDVAVFDLWHCQRYGIDAQQLNLIEQVKGYVRYSCASCILQHDTATQISRLIKLEIKHSECQLYRLLANED